MVETWRWPNASYSVLSIWLGVEAQPAGGGAVDDQVGLQALLLLVGIDVGQHRVVSSARSTSFGAQSYRSAVLSACSVYW